MSLSNLAGPPKGKKKNYIADDIKSLYKKNVPVDNKPVFSLIKEAAEVGGVDPEMLFASAFQEGMNKAVAYPDEISQAYENNLSYEDQQAFPVDGFYNYGLDRFAERYDSLKKYLPEDFEFKEFEGVNEKKSKVRTAAFKDNKSALIAKAAMIRAEMDTVRDYASKKGIPLDKKAVQYFTMAAYNGGFGNAKIMLDEYATSKDKTSFIDKGMTSRKGVHVNIMPRMENINVAGSVLGPMAGEKQGPFSNQTGIMKQLMR